MAAQVQNQCPNCGELITFAVDWLHCQHCGYREDYPYQDEDDDHYGNNDVRDFEWCEQCNGTGLDFDATEDCPHCDGLGYKWWL